MSSASKLTVQLLLILNLVFSTNALPRILIYSRTLGQVFALFTLHSRALSYTLGRFRHDSIPTAIEALKTNGTKYSVTFDTTEDPTQFTASNLANYDAILFLSTTDSSDNPRQEILDGNEKASQSPSTKETFHLLPNDATS